MSVFGRISGSIQAWLEHQFTISDTGLAWCRVFYALAVLFVVVPEYVKHSDWITTLPDVLYYPPPGPMMLLDGFFPASVVYGLIALIIVSSLALLVGIRARSAALLLGVALLAFDGNLYSVGKIDHGRVLLSWFPVVMAWSSWGNRLRLFSRDAEPVSHTSWPYKLFALILAFGLFTAGLPKLLGGWLSLDTQASYAKFAANYHGLGRHELLAPFLIARQDWTLFWEVQDWSTVCFEVGFLWSICRTRLFRFFIALAVLFHCGVMLVMNIIFPEQLLLYVMFWDWSRFENAHGVKLIAAFLGFYAMTLIPVSLAGISLFVWMLYGVSLIAAGYMAYDGALHVRAWLASTLTRRRV